MPYLIECAICGKKFRKSPCSIYNLKFDDKVYQCCSYNCFQIAERTKHENNSSEYKRIRMSINDEVSK